MTKAEMTKRAKQIINYLCEAANDGPGGATPPGGPRVKIGPLEKGQAVEQIICLVNEAIETAKK